MPNFLAPTPSHFCPSQPSPHRRISGPKSLGLGSFFLHHLSGTGDSQCDSRESIRANHSQSKPLFYSASSRFAQITRISDSRESGDSRESCESIRANHATKCIIVLALSACREDSEGRTGITTTCPFLSVFPRKNNNCWAANFHRLM